MKGAILAGMAALLAVILTVQTFAQEATPQPAQEGPIESSPILTEAVTATQVVTAAQAVTTTQEVTANQAVTATQGVTSPPEVTTTTPVTTTIITETTVVETETVTEPMPPDPLVITDTLPPADVTLNLTAAFPLDPFLVSVNGGGPFAAAGLGPGCTGYVSAAPTVALDWAGEAEFVEAFFYSDHDPMLVVQTPSGEFLCNDDANDVLLDPVIEVRNPAPGRYHIWVGSYAQDQRIPGLLVLTTNPAVNIGTFAPGELVRRASIPEDVVEPAEVAVTQLPTAGGARDVPALEPGFEPLAVAIVVTGTVPAFDLPIRGAVCTGYINPSIDFSFTWSGTTPSLRVFFEGSDDATLLVVGPGGTVYCNDDVTAGQNLNPMVVIPNPPEGGYLVFVGRLTQETPVEGTLTIAESAEREPAVLAPGE